MATKISAPQNGAQGQGVATQGNNNTVLTGNAASLTGVGGNVSINNGVSSSDLTSLLGEFSRPSSAAVAAATPPAVTPPATPAATDSKKKFILYGLCAVAGLVVFFIVRKMSGK
jgi:hypothetical protein